MIYFFFHPGIGFEISKVEEGRFEHLFDPQPAVFCKRPARCFMQCGYGPPGKASHENKIKTRRNLYFL